MFKFGVPSPYSEIERKNLNSHDVQNCANQAHLKILICSNFNTIVHRTMISSAMYMFGWYGDCASDAHKARVVSLKLMLIRGI